MIHICTIAARCIGKDPVCCFFKGNAFFGNLPQDVSADEIDGFRFFRCRSKPHGLVEQLDLMGKQVAEYTADRYNYIYTRPSQFFLRDKFNVADLAQFIGFWPGTDKGQCLGNPFPVTFQIIGSPQDDRYRFRKAAAFLTIAGQKFFR